MFLVPGEQLVRPSINFEQESCRLCRIKKSVKLKELFQVNRFSKQELLFS